MAPSLQVTLLGFSNREPSGCSTKSASSLDIDLAQMKLKLEKHKIKQVGDDDDLSHLKLAPRWRPGLKSHMLVGACARPGVRGSSKIIVGPLSNNAGRNRTNLKMEAQEKLWKTMR
jgi:hypothetical protein